MVEIVAELSGNHGGKLDNAIRLIAEAKKAGCDAVKFQCFEPERLARKRVGVVWEGKSRSYEDLLAIYTKTHTPKDWFRGLSQYAARIDIPWFSSVFDPADVSFLKTLDCPRYKISAYEMLDGDLIKAVVATGKPIVMSVRARSGLTLLVATEYSGEIMPLGLSDHTPYDHNVDDLIDPETPMVERHLCLPGVDTPDAAFSSSPDEMEEYVRLIRGLSL